MRVLNPNVNKQWFDDRLKAIGRSQREMAFGISLDPAQLNRTLKGLRILKAGEVGEWARFLDVPSDTILKQMGMNTWRAGENPNISPLSMARPDNVSRQELDVPRGWDRRNATGQDNLPRPSGVTEQPMLPMFGGALWATEGEDTVEFAKEPTDYIARPTSVMGVKTAYAVKYPGGHMSPRYKAGDVLIADPTKGITPGAEVVIHVAPLKVGDQPMMLVKEFVRRDGGAAVFRQHSPEAEITIGREQILHVHKIVGVEVA